MARAAAVAPLRELEAEDIADVRERLASFLQPFQDLLVREEQRGHLAVYVGGRLLSLPRRTGEPIALEARVKARPLQHFVGQGRWADEDLREAMAGFVAEKMGSARGVLILDGSGFQKWGSASVGVQRQWCGRLGKQENCQVAEFLAYAARGRAVLLDCRLYLPEMWAADEEVRRACQVPPEVPFLKGWQLALDMVCGLGQRVPHAWVVGDDCYGQVCALRDALHEAGERYVLEVPAKAKVRLVHNGTWGHAGSWADSLPPHAWRRFTLRDGEKGPMPVRAAKVRVQCERKPRDGGGRPEVLLVVDSLHSDKRWYYLCSDTRARLVELVRAASCRHGVEEGLRYAKGEVGMAEYEVRGWVGWHHHMTLCLMAQWFLASERAWLEKRGYALPSRRYAECWPTCLYPPPPSPNSPSASAGSSDAPTRPASATGAPMASAPHRPATSPARPCAKHARSSPRAHLAQYN